MLELNYLAILISTIVAFGIGGLWYGPLFGRLWMKLMGFSQEDLEKMKKKGGMGKSYALMFVSQFILAYVLAHFILGWAQNAPDTGRLSIGLQTGFWLWLGLVATIQLGTVLWEQKSWKLYMLNITHWLIVILVMSSILAMWQ